MIDELGLGERIIFPGFVPDEEIPKFYNLAELFLFPSIYEGFGIPILEAMACGCPVITSMTGCAPEVAGGAGVLVDPYDPDDIAYSIKRIVEDPTYRQTLVERGLEHVKSFGWDRCAAQTLEVFESCMYSEKSSHDIAPQLDHAPNLLQ